MLYKPMLARPAGKEALTKEGYIFEPKLDGTRAICYKSAADGLRFVNRRNADMTSRYPEFSFADDVKAKTAVLDGEVVVYDANGNPSFTLLQRREQTSDKALVGIREAVHPATYVAFDILEKDGLDLTGLALLDRKKILDETVTEGKSLQKMFFTGDGPGLWKEILKRKLEGVVAKDSASKYYPGARAPVWLKIKYLKTIDCIIAGYTSEKRVISALALAAYVEEKLRYIGRAVGKGFTEGFLEELHTRLEKIETKEAPVKYLGEKDIHWVRPELVCEVSFLMLTKDLIMRAPVFLRLREDKRPGECILEEQVVF
jgi:bifunctional non-homologous end joining protein LigD